MVANKERRILPPRATKKYQNAIATFEYYLIINNLQSTKSKI